MNPYPIPSGHNHAKVQEGVIMIDLIRVKCRYLGLILKKRWGCVNNFISGGG
jgi:hypothetical protein